MEEPTTEQLIFALTSSEILAINEPEIVLYLEIAERINKSATKFIKKL